MFDRVLMHIIQSCEIAFFVSQRRLPVVVPDFSACCCVQAIDPSCAVLVKVGQEGLQRFSTFRLWGLGNEVVVVWKDCPSFELPVIFGRIFEKAVVQGFQPLITRKKNVLSDRFPPSR